MIKNEEITFVVQGPVVSGVTNNCLTSIRHHYPGAIIVLSTWEGTSLEGLDYDKVVASVDPGDCGLMFPNLSNVNNINRQIVSTHNALKTVYTRYAVKTRTDFVLTNNNLKNYLDKYREYTIDSSLRCFSERIVALGAHRMYPYFVMDFVFAGRSRDLKKLFDIPLMSMRDAQYFPSHMPICLSEYYKMPANFRLIPEQYLVSSALKQDITDYSVNTPDVIEHSNLALASNFVLLDFERVGVVPVKESLKWLLKQDKNTFVFYEDWLNMYKYYIGL